MSQFSKKWEELNFSDNFIFCKVMKNKNLCKQLLEILTGIKVEKISYIESEHAIDNFYDSRGIRMDVFVKDSNKIYDIEMQTGDYENLLLRARYYQSASDISSTPRRTKYQNLKETFIIFICKDDPFGEGLPLYTEKKSFLETDKIPYDDKSRKFFYNSSAYQKAKDENVRDVLEFIYTLKAKSIFTKELEEEVKEAKTEPVFKDEYMYFSDILEEEKEKSQKTGFEEGLSEGLKSGITKGRIEKLKEQITKKIEKGKTDEQIADEVELSLEETRVLIKQCLEQK